MTIRKNIALLMVLSVSTLVACKSAHQAQNSQPQEIPQQTKETPNKQPELPKYTTSTPSFSASTSIPTPDTPSPSNPTPTTPPLLELQPHQSTTHETETENAHTPQKSESESEPESGNLVSHPVNETESDEEIGNLTSKFIQELSQHKNNKLPREIKTLFENSEKEIKFLQALWQKLKSFDNNVKEKAIKYLNIQNKPNIEKIKKFVEDNENNFKEYKFNVNQFKNSLIHALLKVTDEALLPKYEQMLREIAEYKKHFRKDNKDFFLTVINNGKPLTGTIDTICTDLNIKKNYLYKKNYLSYKLQGNHFAGIFFNLKEKLEEKNNKEKLTTEELLGIIYDHAKQKSTRIGEYELKLIVSCKNKIPVNHFKNKINNIYSEMINDIRQKNDKEKDINSYIKEFKDFPKHKNISQHVTTILNDHDLSHDDDDLESNSPQLECQIHDSTYNETNLQSTPVTPHSIQLSDISESEEG